MKFLLCLALIAASAAVSFAENTDVDPRFAFINWEDNGIRFDFNSTSIAYGVVTVVVVALLLLVLIPLLTGVLGGEEETGYSAHTATAYDPYSSYKRSLEAAMPIVDQLQTVWEKLQ